MGVDSLIDEDDDELGVDPEATIQDLINLYGPEVVKRGISYMESLRKADENFKKAADPETMKDGYVNIAGSEDLSDEVKEASEKWADAMEGGLRLDGEDD